MIIIASKIAEAEFGRDSLMELVGTVVRKNVIMIEDESPFTCHCVLEGKIGLKEVLVIATTHEEKYTMVIRMNAELEMEIEDL